MSYVNSVRLGNEDGPRGDPPTFIITITGHSSTEHAPGDELSITVSAFHEDNKLTTETPVADFHIAADDLYAAIDLVLGHTPVRHPEEDA